MIYYSRYFRLLPGAELPRGPWLWGPRAELPFALATVHLAERGVHSITFGVPTFDAELKALRDPRAFAAGCALLPAFAPWCEPSRTEPITEVLAMGGLPGCGGGDGTGHDSPASGKGNRTQFPG